MTTTQLTIPLPRFGARRLSLYQHSWIAINPESNPLEQEVAKSEIRPAMAPNGDLGSIGSRRIVGNTYKACVDDLGKTFLRVARDSTRAPLRRDGDYTSKWQSTRFKDPAIAGKATILTLRTTGRILSVTHPKAKEHHARQRRICLLNWCENHRPPGRGTAPIQ